MSKDREFGRAAALSPEADRSGSLEAVARSLHGREPGAPAPVERWDPPYCGELDIRIREDGSWWYLGSPIGRPALIRLFGSVLRKDADGRHYLVTPVEKIAITVEDAPFIGVDVDRVDTPEGEAIRVLTNLGDAALLGPDRPLRIERDPETGEPAPYARIRGRLEARLDRKSFLRLADMGAFRDGPEGRMFGVASRGAFFALASAAELGEEDPAAE